MALHDIEARRALVLAAAESGIQDPQAPNEQGNPIDEEDAVGLDHHCWLGKLVKNGGYI